MTESDNDVLGAMPGPLMLGAPMARQSQIRAVRNNNPGNIERGTKWIGLAKPEDMTAAQKAEGRFAVFSHPKYGFRAMATVILTYVRKRKAKDGSAIDTIADVIARWAPPVENDTGAYARAVAKAVGVSPDRKVDFEDVTILRPLIKAMAIHEAGGWYFKDADLDEGLKLVGVTRKVASPTAKREAGAIAAGTIAAGTAGVVEVVKEANDAYQAAKPSLDSWQGFASLMPTAGLVIAVLVLLYLGYRFIRRHQRETA